MIRKATVVRRFSFDRRFVRIAAAAAVGASLMGCAAAPLSYLYDEQVYYQAELNRYPLRVVAIDGAYQAIRPVHIAPGPHLLTLDAVPVAGFSLPVQKLVPLTIAPCTRYYLAAQRRSPLLQDWTMVVEETASVAGCDPATELERAKVAGIAGQPVATSSVIEPTPMTAVASAVAR